MADAVFNSCNSFQPVGRKITLLEARVNFGGLQQHLDQTVEDFAAVLRAAAVDCRFGAYLDEHLRDRFVFGLIPGPIHDLLLQEDFNITFSDAVKKASDLERLWSRPLLVPDWLAPQSIFSSDPLEDDNSASRPQLSESTLTSLYSEPLHSGPTSCYDSEPQLSKFVVRRTVYYSSLGATTTAGAWWNQRPDWIDQVGTVRTNRRQDPGPGPSRSPTEQRRASRKRSHQDLSFWSWSLDSGPNRDRPPCRRATLRKRAHRDLPVSSRSLDHGPGLDRPCCRRGISRIRAPPDLWSAFDQSPSGLRRTTRSGAHRDLPVSTRSLAQIYQNPRSSRPALFTTNVARPAHWRAALLCSNVGHVRLRLPRFREPRLWSGRPDLINSGCDPRLTRRSALASIIRSTEASVFTAIIARNVEKRLTIGYSRNIRITVLRPSWF